MFKVLFWKIKAFRLHLLQNSSTPLGWASVQLRYPVHAFGFTACEDMTSSVNSNAVLCVKGEIHNVLTVLRHNSRWATRERFSREVPLQAESPLARAFKSLHSYLEAVDDLANVDTVR